MHRLSKVVFAAIACTMVAAAQNPITADTPFQVRYASNLTAGDSIINLTNTGANGASLYGPGFGGATGNICVNVYAVDPGEELVACCSCLVTPDGLASLSVVNDLISNTETSVRPTSVVVKLVSTLAGTGGTGTSCSGSAATASTATLATGLAAWGTTIHSSPAGTMSVTETAFTPATLSAAELASLSGRCRSIVGNSSGAGICASCRVGGLGAKKSSL
jgi:hypothetical protein